MIGHIFRKDWKLLWRMAIGVALINLIQRVNLSSAGVFFRAGMSPQVLLSGALQFIGLLATGVLIVLAVQEDSIPGLTQDWLVRPMRRRDLLLSKILFVALLVQGPIFVIEVGQCLAAGFPIGQSLAAPLSRSVWMFLAMDLPVLAFATLTRSLSQAAGAAMAVFLGWVAFTASAQMHRLYLDRIWLDDFAQMAWGLAVTAVLLALQYYRRKTTRARWVYGAAAVVWLFVPLLPWKPAFAVEKRLSPRPAAADAIQFAFDPAFDKYRRRPGEEPPVSFRLSRPTNDVDVWAPLGVSGVGDRQMLTTDSALVTIREPGGAKIDLPGSQIPWDAKEPFHYLIFIPEEVYDRLKDQPVGIVIDYSLTLVQATAPQAIPANGGDRWVEGVGRCATRASPGGTFVELGCLSAGRTPCLADYVEYPATRQPIARNPARNPDRNPACGSDYAPYVDHIDGDSISRFAREIPFRGLQWKDARVVLTAYHPVAHFTRQVVIPNIRLSDWRPE